MTPQQDQENLRQITLNRVKAYVRLVIIITVILTAILLAKVFG